MADISLKNGAGSAVTYNSITQLKIPAADGGEDVVFQLPPVMQEKAVTITANGTSSIVPDEGKDGLSKVDVTVDVAGGGTADNAIYGAVYKTGVKKINVPAGWSLQKYPAATAKIPKEATVVSVCYIRVTEAVAQYNLPFKETIDYMLDTSNAAYNTVTIAESGDEVYANSDNTAKDVYFYTCVVVRFRYTGITGTKNGNAYDVVISDLTPWEGVDLNMWSLVNLTPWKTAVIQENMPVSRGLFAYQPFLEKIVFPPVVTKLYSASMSGDGNLSEFDFSQATVVPQLDSAYLFSEAGLPDNYVIKVPAALYDDWKAASYWSTSSVVSHIVAV